MPDAQPAETVNAEKLRVTITRWSPSGRSMNEAQSEGSDER
jgi:hypothetical protein